MEVKGLDGKQYKLSFNGKTSDKVDNRSSLHLRAREILKEIYPVDRIMEEVMLPGSGGLYCNFFLPNRLLIVEAHGKQHYEFTPFFHKSRIDFIHSKKRDRNKTNWCEINNVTMIILPYNEDDLTWKKRLLRQL